MKIYYIILCFILPSFIKCLSDRYPTYLSSPRSRCDFCKHSLHFFDLIPIISYLFLKGRCRYCKSKIDPSNLLIELIFPLVLYLLYIRYPSYIKLYIVFNFLCLAALVDIRCLEIPDLCIICLLLNNVSNLDKLNHLILLVGILLAYLGLMGFGDIKLIWVISSYLPFYSLIFSILIASISALIFIILFKMYKKKIPFAPFLSIGIFLNLLLIYS